MNLPTRNHFITFCSSVSNDHFGKGCHNLLALGGTSGNIIYRGLLWWAGKPRPESEHQVMGQVCDRTRASVWGREEPLGSTRVQLRGTGSELSFQGNGRMDKKGPSGGQRACSLPHSLRTPAFTRSFIHPPGKGPPWLILPWSLRP